MPPIATPEFLDRLRSLPDLPPHVWYYVTMIALSVLNRPDEIPLVWRHALTTDAITGSDGEEYVKEEREWLLQQDVDEDRIGTVDDEGKESALRIARRCREGLLKAGGIGGLPKTINSLMAFRNALPPHLLDPRPAAQSHPTLRGVSLPYPPFSTSQFTFTYSSTPSVTDFISRGTRFYDKLYGPIGRRIQTNMGASYADLEVLAAWMYGLVLSEETVLSGRETGFMMIAALVPQDVNAQLVGHLKGAINFGATREEVMAVRGLVIEICKEAGVAWKGEVAKL